MIQVKHRAGQGGAGHSRFTNGMCAKAGNICKAAVFVCDSANGFVGVAVVGICCLLSAVRA